MTQAGWTINDYTTASGDSPVRAFLSGLRGQDRVEAFALIQLLAERGNTLRRPHSRPLGGGLFELRGTQVRIFYVLRPQRRIVLLGGMLKKRGDIPPAVLQRLRKMQREIPS
jgi:hypothetical protein